MKVQVCFGSWDPSQPLGPRKLYTFETPEGVDAEPGDQFRTHGARVTVVEAESEYDGEVATLDEKIEEEEAPGAAA